MKKEFFSGEFAQAYCTKENECKELDAILLIEITKIANARVQPLLEAIEVLKAALYFYEDKDNWDEENPLGQTPSCWDDGAVDLGNRAKEALIRADKILEGRG